MGVDDGSNEYMQIIVVMYIVWINAFALFALLFNCEKWWKKFSSMNRNVIYVQNSNLNFSHIMLDGGTFKNIPTKKK